MKIPTARQWMLALVLFLGCHSHCSAQTGPTYFLKFDGTNDFVEVPFFGTNAPTAEITVEFWQNVNEARRQLSFVMTPDLAGNRMMVHAPWIDGWVYWDYGSDRLSYLPATSFVGGWHHFAFVASQSGNYMRVYQDGVLQAEKTGMTPFVQGNHTLQIGGLTGYHFFGAMGEFRVWNVARSAAEIQANMNSLSNGSNPGLLLHYRFNEGTGMTATNTASPGVYDGTLRNGVEWDAAIPPTAITLLATNVSNAEATLRAAVDVGSDPTTVWFQYGPIGSVLSNVTPATNLLVSGPVSWHLTGLQTNTTYSFQAIATNVWGASTGVLTHFVLAGNGTNYLLRFDGTNDFVEVSGFGTNAPTTEITIEFWQNVNEARRQLSFVLIPDQGGNRMIAHVPWIDGKVYWDYGNDRLSYLPATTFFGDWHHFAFVASQSGNYMRVYQNGVLQAQKTGTTPFVRGNYTLQIGGLAGYHYFGAMDEFRIWNVARSEAEIQANMNGFSAWESGLLLYYPLNEGTGTNLINRASPGWGNGILRNGVAWGDMITLPIATTLAATNVLGSQATLRATVDIGSQPVTAWFQYGPFGSVLTNATSLTNLVVSGSMSSVLTGLQANITYSYQVIASNVLGSSTGAMVNFATTFPPPIATTLAATNVLGSQATLRATVNSGSEPVSAWFKFGPFGSALTNLTPVNNLSVGGSMSSVLSGLQTNTTYSYQVIATNAWGSSTGAVVNFFTTYQPPNATTLAATNILNAQATLRATVDIGSEPVAVWFQYWLVGSTSINVTSATNLSVSGSVSLVLTGLQTNTTYSFQVVASNASGSSTGAVMNFATGPNIAAIPQSVGWMENTSPTNTLTGVWVTGGVTNFAIVQNPLYGQIILLTGFSTNGLWRYQPFATNFHGTDSFTFRVSAAGSTSTPALVSLTVTNISAPPFAHPQFLKTRPGQSLEITLTGDDDADYPYSVTNGTNWHYSPDIRELNLKYILMSLPTNGFLTANGVAITNGPLFTPQLTYTPTNANKLDGFTFKVSDGGLTSQVATVMLRVAEYHIGTSYFGTNFSLPFNTNHTTDVPLANPGTIRPGFTNVAVPRSDDASTQLNLTTNFLDRLGRANGFNFFTNPTRYANLYVNNNGLLSFNTGVSAYNNAAFPANPTYGPLLAPLWCDVDTRSTVKGGVVESGMGYVDGRQAMFFTWNDVGRYNLKTDKLNRFQAVLIDRSDLRPGNFEVEYNYEYIEWFFGDATANQYPGAGFDVGDGTNYYNLPGALTTNVAAYVTNSNLSPPVPGRYRFRLYTPTVAITTNLMANNIHMTTATLNGIVRPNRAWTLPYFQISTVISGVTNFFTNAYAAPISSGQTNPVPVSLNVNGLTFGTTYLVSLVASNEFGYLPGNSNSVFTTAYPLSSLALSPLTLSPSFNPALTNYNAVMPADQPVEIQALPGSPQVTLRYRTNSGAPTISSGPFDLTLRPTNHVFIDAISEGGTITNTYTIMVERLPSTASHLASLSLSAGAFSQPFNSNVFSYSLTIPSAIGSTTVSAGIGHAYETIQYRLNGGAYTASSGPFALNLGFNTIDVLVTAEDGVSTTLYTISVERLESSDSSLAEITLSQGTLSPLFSSGVTTYEATVPPTTTNIVVGAVATYSNAMVKINGGPFILGTNTVTLPLIYNANPVVISVQAENGIALTQYSLTINRSPATPTVITLSADGVTSTVHGTANPNGAETLVYFQYGTNTSYGGVSTTNVLPVADEFFSITNALAGLEMGATYHYRIVAENGAGTNFGANMLFTNLPAADLAVTISASPEPVGVGTNLTYSITVTNRGPNPSLAVSLTNTLAENVTLSFASEGGVFDGATVIYHFDNLEVGEGTNITLVVNASTWHGDITNSVFVSGGLLDTNLLNNSAFAVSSGHPFIDAGPVSRTNNAGTMATFDVVVRGNFLSFQWLKNGNPLSDGGHVSGVNSASLALTNVLAAEEGEYSVIISNAAGMVMSDTALLTVIFSRPELVAAAVSEGNFRFTLAGETGRGYDIETSTNLIHWEILTTIVLTNDTYEFSSGATDSKRFFRALHRAD